jgi:hypothetical protein
MCVSNRGQGSVKETCFKQGRHKQSCSTHGRFKQQGDMGLSKRGFYVNRGVTNRGVLTMGVSNNRGQGSVKEMCFK